MKSYSLKSISSRAGSCGADLGCLTLFIILFSSTSGLATDLAELKNQFRRPVEIPFPKENLYTPEKAALGKALFFEPRLSGNQNASCSTCHNPSFGWEAPGKTAVGAQNTHLPRKGPTVLNTAWVHPLFWDGRADSLEAQAEGPITSSGEMNLPLTEAIKRLKAVPGYASWFDKVFPGEGVKETTILKAVATFERTVVSSYAPFDRWIDGEENAISESAKRGFVVFTGKGHCSACHAGWNFTDNQFHDIGTTNTDIGRGKLDPTSVKAAYAFKTPTLRDTAQRAPYMHDGEFATLEEVVEHYETGGIDRPSRSSDMKKIDLSDTEKADLIAFLNTLTGARAQITLPILPN